ncbi:RAM signaling network component [Serendipita sp. 399]|nr:RAM signaling network component [Serendipita sp. 399]
MIYADPSSPSDGVPLSSSHITSSIVGPEAPSSLDFSRLGISEIPDEAIQQLAHLAEGGDSQTDGTIYRIALSNNRLRTLPPSFNLLWRLRYLNLRSNALLHFPEVLSEMRSLEILDLSRNKIKSFPVSPGMLINIRVLHLGRNQIEALPTYFPNFRELNLLKIENNPIMWPPPHVLKATGSVSANDVDPQKWVHTIQGWIRDHLARQDRVNPDDRRTDSRAEAYESRYPIHDRTPSVESVGSQTSNYSHFSIPDSPKDHRTLNRLLAPDGLDGYSSSDRSTSVDGHSVLLPHSRNPSLTISKKSNLNPKKSLPDIRSMRSAADRRAKGRPVPLEAPPIQHQISLSKGSVSDTGHTIRPSARTTVRESDEPENMQLPAMDVERNSYFRRMSTLPASTISKAVPKCLLVTVDAARGILFALSQVYSALRHYIVFAINDRLAGVLNKVLDPASQYLARLITALDRFDALCRSGTPRPAACRGVLESCRDNINVFIKVVGVLGIQLKVLAGSDDVRYTRTLMLMLYGSMGELSNSWNSMVPHIEEVRNLVRDEPYSSSHNNSFSLASLRSPQMILEMGEGELSEASLRSQISAVPRPRTATSARRQQRGGGSYSEIDVQIGKDLPIAHSNTVLPLNIKRPSETSKNLRRDLERRPNGSPRLNQPFALGASMHSPSLSSSSHGHGNSTSDGGDVAIANGVTVLSSDKDKLVDESMLNAMKEATDLALSVWKQVEDLFESTNAGPIIPRDYLMRAREVTMSLQSNIRVVLEGTDGDIYASALWEGANTFSKVSKAVRSSVPSLSDAQIAINNVQDVTNVLMLVKKTCTEQRIQLKSSLRTDLQKLSRLTQEFVTFLGFSSFAAGKPPASPLPNGLMSPTYDERTATPTTAMSAGISSELMSPSNPLWRSRSANVVASPALGPVALNRGGGTVGSPAVYQSPGNGMREMPPRGGPAHPSLHNFRMPPSPAPGGRRHANGIVGYKDST